MSLIVQFMKGRDGRPRLAHSIDESLEAKQEKQGHIGR